MLAVLIGAMPPKGPAVLSKLGIPYILLANPGDRSPLVMTEPVAQVTSWTQFLGAARQPEKVAEPLRVVSVPFKSDPLSVLRVSFPEEITHVFSFTELGQLPAALLAEALGVPTVGTAAVLKTRNKFFMRRALVDTLIQPEFGLLDRWTDQPIPYPVVAKPVDSSGSKGVEHIESPTRLQQRLEQDGPCLWEQYIGGSEYSVEAVTFQGEHHILGITEKITTGFPHFVEVGHFSPARLPDDVASNIICTVKACLDGLGISKGATHTEVKYYNDQTFIIETHTRAGGDRITLLTEMVSGHIHRELAARSILGQQMPVAGERKCACAGIRFFLWEDRVVDYVEGTQECLQQPWVAELEIKVEQGQRMPQWRDSTDRPGYVVVEGANFLEVQERLFTAENALRVRYMQA